MTQTTCNECNRLLGPHGHDGADALTTLARLLTEALSGKRYEDDFGGVQNPLGITANNLSIPINEQRRFGDLLPLMYSGVDNRVPKQEYLTLPLVIVRVTNFNDREILLDGSHRLNYWKRIGENPDSLKAVHVHEVTLTDEQITRLTALA